jgi:hypothetical protein
MPRSTIRSVKAHTITPSVSGDKPHLDRARGWSFDMDYRVRPRPRRGGWPSSFGVELESAVRAVPQGVAQLITGPEGNSALGLVQERG